MQIIQKAMREKFKDFRVVIPQEAGLAILQGAVLFGENPLIVSERESALSPMAAPFLLRWRSSGILV